MSRIAAALAAVLVLSACADGAVKDAEVVVPKGASLTAAAKALEKAGAITDADAFLTHAKVMGPKGQIKPGEYAVKKGMSANDILALLQSGKTVQRLITIPEGMPSILVAEKLMATPLLTGTIDVPAEGSVLPDSYAYTRDEPRAKVLARMQAAMTKALDDAWAKRTPAAAVRTKADAVNLASIVEKETGLASDRPMVASVYTNRLKIGMPLQADPTVIYPVTKGKPLGRRILRSELDASNAYNTYRIPGLPPGPITNPGKASIEAVLAPPASKALFFVAKGDGSSAFAETLAEHNRNVQAWYALRRQRGEM